MAKDRWIGLLAAWGQLPIVVAQALRDQGYRIACVGVHDHVSQQLRELSDVYCELGLGRLGAAIRFFRKHDVAEATMAGKFHKVRIFKPFTIFRHLPDWTTIRTMYPFFVSGSKDRRDDTMLGAVVDAFAEQGIHFAPATDFAPELLVNHGLICGRPLSRHQTLDLEFGWRMAKEIGRLDIGQTVVVKGQAVLAVEAIEGTDQCIRRAGQLCASGGFTVVKVAKPEQDMRFDVPTIGVGTIRTLIESGGSVLAVEADKTILLDHDEMARLARRHSLTVIATRCDEPAMARAS